MTDIFGDIIIANQLEAAVIATLESWFPTYIREVELQSQSAQYGDNIPTDALPLPRSFITTDKIQRENTDQLPAIVVVSPGLSPHNRPQQEGDGTFRVPWAVSVGVFVSGQDRTSTKNLIRQYTGIARAIMLQKQSLGGFADGTTWLDESYDDAFAFVDQETIGAGSVVFEVWVAGVVNRFAGPAVYGGTATPDPDTQPGEQWPPIDTVENVVIVNKE
jgi:hypothetical protein